MIAEFIAWGEPDESDVWGARHMDSPTPTAIDVELNRLYPDGSADISRGGSTRLQVVEGDGVGNWRFKGGQRKNAIDTVISDVQLLLNDSDPKLRRIGRALRVILKLLLLRGQA
jgi:hypothetical protein